MARPDPVRRTKQPEVIDLAAIKLNAEARLIASVFFAKTVS